MEGRGDVVLSVYCGEYLFEMDFEGLSLKKCSVNVPVPFSV